MPPGPVVFLGGSKVPFAWRSVPAIVVSSYTVLTSIRHPVHTRRREARLGIVKVGEFKVQPQLVHPGTGFDDHFAEVVAHTNALASVREVGVGGSPV